MFKSIVAAVSVFASALFAHAANVSGVTLVNVELVNDNTYQAAPVYSANLSNYNHGSGCGWVAGIKLTWDKNKQKTADTSVSVTDNADSLNQVSYSASTYNTSSGNQAPDNSGMKNTMTSSGLFTKTYYMSTTEWYVCITPEILYSLGETDYSATLNIGGNIYTITVPNNIVLSDGSHQWYPAVGLLGEKVYGEAQYLANQIDVTNYDTVKFLVEPVGVTFGDGFAASDNGDGTWGVTMTHSHTWAYSVDGATLTATCGNAGCPVGGSTTVSLTLSGSDKVYDNKAITASADFDSSFKTIFPDAEATVSTTKDGEPIDNDKIKDVGEYVVTMIVTGLGDGQSYELSKTVTILPVDITGATLVLSPATTPYIGTEQTVTPSVTANNLAATIVVDTESSTTAATEMGTYSVTVNGTGNFTGTATATWSIVNTTGTGSTVAASTADSMTVSGNDFALSDSAKLEYDAENEIWYAGITITWPVTTHNATISGGYAQYVKTDTKKIEYSVGTVQDKTSEGSYKPNALSTTKFTYLDTTTWKVPLTPAIISEALAEDKTSLTYTMIAGAFIWGNSTEGDTDGVMFQDYTITIPLDENLKLYDNYGNQVYPAVDYVAQIDGKKYVSLADAFAASESGQTVTLIAQDDYDGEYEILEGVTVELGAFGSSDATYVLSIGSVLTSDAECTVSTRETGYGVERSGEGPYTYSVVMLHVHDWDVDVSGSVLTATCVADACPLDVTTYSMRLFAGVKSGATEDVDGKVYDGESMSRKAEFGNGFTDVFPDVETQISVTKGGESVDAINDVGEYVVTMTVTGLGDGQSYELSKTVTISPVDISESALVLTPATTTYNGESQTVATSVTANNLSATIVVDAENSTTSATDIGTYSVTVNGTGNFTGSATATWSIVNTTGSLNGITSAVSGIGDFDSANNTLAITDSTALEFSDGAWYAGITLEWPVETKGYSGIGQYGYAHYITEASAKFEADEGMFTNESGHGSYQYNLVSSHSFDYLSNTTWKVAITPAVVEAALNEEKTALEWTMRAGAIPSDTYETGVEFADYKIALPLDNPVVFALGEGEAHDLGATVLTTTKIQLAAGASVTSAVQQTEGAIFTAATGYGIVCSEDEGKYVYTTKFTHVHDWSVSKAANGYELVATCANPECDINGGEVKIWLDVGVAEKTYDGSSVTRKAEFGDGFKTVYPDAAAVLTVNGVEDGAINNASEYEVALTVTGVGEETYTLSRTVTVSKADITGATLVFAPATLTYNCAEQTVAPSVKVGEVTATLENNGLEVAEGTCTATAIGTYSVTVNGTGNFTGTATATWSIVNTTGEPTSVAASADGSMTNIGNDFTLSDSAKLEYDAEQEKWYAGITITWPMEKKDWQLLDWDYYAHYVAESSIRFAMDYGETNNVAHTDSYKNGVASSRNFTSVSNTTWKVAITPALIEAALAEEKTELVYTMKAGAIVWGDDTEGDPDGVAFDDYMITIPLDETLKLYDGDGKQVYPKAEGQTIIDDIKDEIDTEVASEVAESAKGKIDDLVNNVAAGESPEQDVAYWVSEMKNGYDTPAAFYAALAESDYVEASFELGTDKLITEESEVKVDEFESAEDGFTFEVKIDDGDIEATLDNVARIIQTATTLGADAFAPLAKERIEISEGNKITVGKDANVDREFFKIVIEKDSAK